MALRHYELAYDRIHEHVLDRETGRWLSLVEYMGGADYGAVIEKKRVGLKLELESGELRYVCPVCEKAMMLASLPIRERNIFRFYFRHQDRNNSCTGERGLSAREICSRKFAQCKEGELHKRFKQWMEQSMRSDPSFSEIDTEKRWKDIDGLRWRQPDVQAMWRGHRIACEAQLSTTFLHVITERMQFYERNQGRLLWLFRDLDTQDFKLSEDDIFYSNNRNAFRLTPDTVALSEQHQRFALECVWYEPMDKGAYSEDVVRQQIVYFDELHFDVSAVGVPRTYFFDYDAAIQAQEQRRREEAEAEARATQEVRRIREEARDQALRQAFEALFVTYPRQWPRCRQEWAPLRVRFEQSGHPLPEFIDQLDGPLYLLMAAYSAKRGEVVGCKLNNFASLANNLFDHHKGALWVFSVMMRHYERSAEMRAHGDMAKWKGRKETYQRAWKAGDPAYAPDRRFDALLRFLFPEAPEDMWIDPADVLS